ncbi:bifunctional [glutamate--ammonia ligase]-adenylyl-L-tyrosine phosphorylase/[glutamate--ammonia-ligase] adenylyltransferase [Pseudoteredinibacter isoporae]|uniref:bifunctional [glutamate--ammonia ligase]-adenylyl-L-tyrosine phosphorylase/[glutamate--ammonia-ligase] adenylyltransferase n=1 Tax=Pseudoteredinibacter isoporae TaxID=570281 RepID=UPI003107812B
MLASYVPDRANFRSTLEQYSQQWQERVSDEQQAALVSLLKNETLAKQLAKAWLGSEFIFHCCRDQPALLFELLDSDELQQSWSRATFTQQLQKYAQSVEKDSELDRVLRQFRRRAMIRIVWRDLNQLASLEETTADMSALAESCTQLALEFHYRALVKRFGLPIGEESGQVQSLVVLGMGKLGARELNVSSDIDLIFSYPESGETQHRHIEVGGRSKKTTSNQEFFNRLGQKIIKSLDAQTVDGFVFRVDMRLRPYGESGSLVMNFGSMEEYYQTQGREWERYAMIKARVIAEGGPLAECLQEEPEQEQTAGEELMELLRPFSYRRYIDFSAIDALRDMKRMINREVHRKGINSDVKLGFGGIREVEFVVQVFQLIRGGRDQRLQERRVLKLLPLLQGDGYLPEGAGDRLADAYRLLRHVEHAIQGHQDKQTQALPMDVDDLERLAWVLNYSGWDALSEDLQQHREQVNAEFQAVIAEPEDDAKEDDEAEAFLPLWLDELDSAAAIELLEQRGYQQADKLLQQLRDLRQSRAVLAMQSEGRNRLDKFMPRLLHTLSLGRNPNEDIAETLSRVLGLVSSVARRTIYLVLLTENPVALAQLVRLCAASPWIADQLSKHPALLDELLDHRSLYSPPSRQELADQLRQECLRIEWDDLEEYMEALRYFRMANVLRIAACEVTDAMPLMKVSDHLTDIAELLLEEVIELAWQQMVTRHGRPRNLDGDIVERPEFLVLGYGKVGGIELGHSSDLDLVFIHGGAAGQSTSGRDDSGERSLDNLIFYTRMAQKMIHIMNTQTVSGQLYEVDMRLRPNGNSGMLVTTIGAFDQYLQEEAWTWEKQALVRARAIAGHPELAMQFDRVRQNILCQPRDLAALREDVVQMREKMRKHLATQGSEGEKALRFDIKQDVGGIVDIEFMVQYGVLAWAHEQPSLAQWTDNIRILGCLEQTGYLSAEDTAQLIEAYKAYRSAGHRLALQRQKSVLHGNTDFQAERQTVQRLWQRFMQLPE